MGASAIFAVIGDALPRNRRAIAFTVQSILKRIPMVLGPLAGAMLIERLGVLTGVQLGLLVTLALSGVCLWTLSTIDLPRLTGPAVTVVGVWRLLSGGLRRLLLADILARAGQGCIEALVVLYVTSVLHLSMTQYAELVAIQLVTSIVIYFPAANVADRLGRRPVVAGTFLFFSLYPVAMAVSTGMAGLTLAFMLAGLREIGEPARKAMIVDFSTAHLRGRSVGLYYLVRSLSVAPAGVLGGLLWALVGPPAPFVVASLLSAGGLVVFLRYVEESYAA